MQTTSRVNMLLWAAVLILGYFAWKTIRPDEQRFAPEANDVQTPLAAPKVVQKKQEWAEIPVEEFLDFLDLEDIPGPNFKGGEVLLGFGSEAELNQFLENANKSGILISASNRKLGLVRVSLNGLKDLAKLASITPDDMEIQRDLPIYAPAPALPREGSEMLSFGTETLPWLGVPEESGNWGRNQKIAILDTGVWTHHTAFDATKITQIDLLNPEQSVPGQYDGHGTAVASIIAGTSETVKGIAPAAEILSIRVLDGEGKGTVYTLAEGIVEAVDRGANIISLSLGSSSDSFVLRKAVNYALENGAILVASAGNESEGQITFPAAYQEVIGVTSVDAGSRIADFSNQGAGVDLAAPGIGLRTAWIGDQEVTFSGTSASAPLVSGALAGILSLEPRLSPAEALQLLYDYSDDGYAAGKDPQLGFGILNLERVLTRNQRGIYDSAVGGYHFSPLTSSSSNKTFEITLQNRGTEWLSGGTLDLKVDSTSKRFYIGSMKPGEVLTQEWFLTPEQILNPEGTLIEAIVNPTGKTDTRPDNNTWSTRMILPGS